MLLLPQRRSVPFQPVRPVLGARLRDRRGIFAELTSQLVREALAAECLEEGDTVVEIGCGDGQLRAWLPDELRDRFVHTDASPATPSLLRAADPAARTLRANARELPLRTGCADAVIGLCVLDEIDDLAALGAELERVLRPGGRLIHFLDLATNLAPVFADLVSRGEVPLPNVLPDLWATHPQLAKCCSGASDPSVDMLACPRQKLATVVAALEQAAHPFAPLLARHLELFAPRRFDPTASSHAYLATIDGETGPRWRSMIGALLVTLFEPRYRDQLPLPLRSEASSHAFTTRLRAALCDKNGFSIDASEVRTARAILPYPVDGAAYRARWIGRDVWRAQPPDDGTEDRPHGVVIEVAIAFFSARRRA